MVLRVQPVPAPAAGRDWTYTVPGNYLMDIKAVQATLATPFGISTLADSSGNGLSLTITNSGNRVTFGQPGPYVGGAKDYSVHGVQQNPFVQTTLLSGTSALLGTNPTSIVALVKLDAGASINPSVIVARVNGGVTEAQLQFPTPATDPADLQLVFGGVTSTLAAGFLPRGAWHLVGATADGVSWRVYLDGVLKATVAGSQPPASSTPQYYVAASGQPFTGNVAGVAVFQTQLTAAQQLAYVAAEGSNAAYKAAVLVDSPSALWMLDDTGNMGSRLATLSVTNGTTETARFPGGTNTGVNGFFTWCWASQAPGTNQSADATVNLVQIPDLVLPAGYTIGTVTPDLGLADSWTGINIWWDDGEIGPGGPVGPAPYLNRLLIPDYGQR